MYFQLITSLIFILFSAQLTIANNVSDIKYPKNEFNSNDSNIPVVGGLSFELKKEIKKDLKKESVMKEIQNENLKLFIKDASAKESVKNLPQRDNSKATSQKEEKLEKLKNNLNKDQSTQQTQSTGSKDTTSKNQTQAPAIDETHLDLADLFIGTITGTNGKMSDFRNASTLNNSKQSGNTTTTASTSALDDLRIKVIEQVHMKAKIFFQVFSQALSGNQLLRESLKNKNDGLVNRINSIYSSTPYLKPFQAPTRPPTNSNNWCASLSNSFAQYAQLNAFLLAAFLLFPVTIPFYLLGWLVLFMTRSIFCIGAKQIFTNIIYRIRSS